MWSAISSAVGSLFDTGVSAYNAHEQRELQRESLAHQKYMDQNGVQVRAADMRAAGINPLMAAGDAASSSASAGSGMSVSSNLGSSAAKAAEASRAYKEAKMFDAQTAQMSSQTKLNDANSAVAVAQAQKLNADTTITLSHIPEALNKSKVHQTWIGREILPYADMILDRLPFLSARKSAFFDHATGQGSSSSSWSLGK